MHKDPFLLHHTDAAELYLIRHGDALPGPDEIIPGGVYDDLPLSKQGREQAHKLAGRLKNTRFDAAYTSPLRRCQETAALLLDYLKMSATTVEEIKEILMGDLGTLPHDSQEHTSAEALAQALQKHQLEMVRIAGNSGHWDDVSKEEKSKDFRARVVHAIDAIAQQHIGQRVLVFCHGGVINAYAADVLGLEQDFFFPCANTSITVTRSDQTRRVLYVLNDVAHLFT